MRAFVMMCAAAVCLSLLADGLWPEAWEEPLDHALQAAGDLLIDLGRALKEVRLFGSAGPRENRARPEAGIRASSCGGMGSLPGRLPRGQPRPMDRRRRSAPWGSPGAAEGSRSNRGRCPPRTGGAPISRMRNRS